MPLLRVGDRPVLAVPGVPAEPGIRYQGLGTEKLHAEVEEKFPGQGLPADGLGHDVASRAATGGCSTPSATGSIHILVGTQMIAKGLDFPNVTLVGVVNADVGLHLPDFRSAERTFQLHRAGGRAGRARATRAGGVYVQTYTPEHPCVTLAAKHDFVGFAKHGADVSHRREHGYPPYQRMARLIVRSEKEDAAAAFADDARRRVQGARCGGSSAAPCVCSARPSARCSA